jgi:hypothetical protein
MHIVYPRPGRVNHPFGLGLVDPPAPAHAHAPAPVTVEDVRDLALRAAAIDPTDAPPNPLASVLLSVWSMLVAAGPEAVEGPLMTLSLQPQFRTRVPAAEAGGDAGDTPDAGRARPFEPSREDSLWWVFEADRRDRQRQGRPVGLVPRDVAEMIAATTLVGHDG